MTTATPSLFDPLPVRNTDPTTSHEAAAMPHLNRLQEAVLVAVVTLGTATKLAVTEHLNGPESSSVSSRLSRLKQYGLVEAVGTVRERRGAPNTVWRATDDGRAMVAWLSERKAS